MQKIVWAVDAFSDTPSQQLDAWLALRRLFPSSQIRVQPVTLLPIGRYVEESHAFVQNWAELADAAAQRLEKLLEPVLSQSLGNGSVLLPPRLLRQDSPSLSAGVHGLLRYALDEEADLIAVSAHARQGMARFLHGSFSEELVLRSPLPVYVVSPKAHVADAAPGRGTIRHLLFATDFSEESWAAFQTVIAIAGELELPVTLFHQLELLGTELPFPFIPPPVDAASLLQLEEQKKRSAERWVQCGKERMVRVEVNVVTEGAPTPEAIVEEAQRVQSTHGPVVLALASHSGPVRALLLGSVTRQVLRTAPCPVLVLHAHQKTLVERFRDEAQRLGYAYSAHPVMT